MTAVIDPRTPANDPAKAPRRGRIHFNPDLAQTYPMEMIQQGWPALEALGRFRFLTSEQLARLLFLGQTNTKGEARGVGAARKATNEVCLRRLKDLRLVECLPIFRHTAGGTFVRGEVNVLTRKGRDRLQEHLLHLGLEPAIDWHPRLKELANQTLNHELQVNDALIAAEVACRCAGVRINSWGDDALRSMKEKGTVGFGDFSPDALIVLTLGEVQVPLIVEVDRGTEAVTGKAPNTWEQKIKRYGRYFKERCRRDPFFAGWPQPLVLTVTTSYERMTHLWEATAEAGGQTGYWFTYREVLDPPAPELPPLPASGPERSAVAAQRKALEEEHARLSLGAFLDPIFLPATLREYRSVLDHLTLQKQAA